MTSEDFVRIFYSNYSPNIDWANVDEITWMFQEGLFTVSVEEIASHNEFIKKIDFVSDPKNGFTKNGESYGHLALKSSAKDFLIKRYNIRITDIRSEYPLVGFEVDIIDKDLRFPVECGDTNALKLEKYLTLSTTEKMLILSYPHSGSVKVFIFEARALFFEYIRHKQNFLSQRNAKLR